LKHLFIGESEAQAYCAMLDSYLPSEIVKNSSERREAVDRLLASLDNLASIEVAKTRAEYFQVADHKLLRERVLFRNGHHVVIAGLRFKKLNPDFPFVQLCANFQFDQSHLLKMKGLIASEYSSLPLKGVTLRHPPSISFDDAHERWSHLVFGKTTGLSAPGPSPDIRVQWEGPLDYYRQYEKEFENFLIENPERASYLSIESEEDLIEAANNRLLMSLWDKAGWIGVIAAKEKDLYGFPCSYIFEIFLAKRARGRGLGPLMQAQFLSKICTRFPYVYGHIDNSNQPSLRTAISLGRKIIETEYFFPFS
jgi:hypothetical protein